MTRAFAFIAMGVAEAYGYDVTSEDLKEIVEPIFSTRTMTFTKEMLRRKQFRIGPDFDELITLSFNNMNRIAGWIAEEFPPPKKPTRADVERIVHRKIRYATANEIKETKSFFPFGKDYS